MPLVPASAGCGVWIAPFAERKHQGPLVGHRVGRISEASPTIRTRNGGSRLRSKPEQRLTALLSEDQPRRVLVDVFDRLVELGERATAVGGGDRDRAARRGSCGVSARPAPVAVVTGANRGIGRAITDAGGRYRFVTIAPGAYPWGNHYNAWRPAHIHFSLFGRAFTQRLVTQMYFPGDPLLPLDPIFNSVPDEKARQRMIAGFDMDLTQPEWALGYTWDIVLRGRAASVFE